MKSDKLSKTLDGTEMVKVDRFDMLVNREDIKTRFREVLGAKSAGFLSSVLSAVNTNSALKECNPMSILSSAMIAATLDLPINSSLGFAYIVPYSGVAQFQVGYKGLIQLCIRTGQYKTMNVSEVYEGELKNYNRITGEIELDITAKVSDKVIGYVAFFRLINGFEKYLYLTREEVERHGKRYSKSFANPKGRWQQDFDAMARKTVLKMLLSKYGIMSIDLQRAVVADQAVGKTIEGDPIDTVEYVDNPDSESKQGEENVAS